MTRVLLIARPGRIRDSLVQALAQAGFEVSTSDSADAGSSDEAAALADAVVLADDDVGEVEAPESGQRAELAFEESLTRRELEVLGLLADGLSNRAIAGRLGISEHTVKVHVSTIYAKLGAANRAEAVTRGVQRGLVVI